MLECQCDALIGPTLHVAGLGVGNRAAHANAGETAYPRQAALQGLEKMRRVHALGAVQYILPPPRRPDETLLARCGLSLEPPPAGDTPLSRHIREAAWSAAAMWMANAATVTPSPDSQDGALHLTPANLVSNLHRVGECESHTQTLTQLLAGKARIHPPLVACAPLRDEGAANHMRLAPAPAEPGLALFVYGEDSTRAERPQRYPARQTRLASEALARLHNLPPERVVLAQQNPRAIDAGAFHHDVVAMSHGPLLIYHGDAFLDEAELVDALTAQADFPLHLVRIPPQELPLSEAIGSYLFNSQLITTAAGTVALLAPRECIRYPRAQATLSRIASDPAIPIEEVAYVDVSESMRGGGGPACLRLRLVLDTQQRAAVPLRYRFTDARHRYLHDWVARHYPETLKASQLADGGFASEMLALHEALLAAFERSAPSATPA